MTSKLLKRWALESYYPLHYYQDLYRALYPLDDEESSVQSSSSLQPLDHLSIPPNRHLTFLKYFFLVYSLRCFAIMFLPCTTGTREARVWIGTENLRKDSLYIETTIFCWCAIAFLFHQITLTDNLLDYTFLALFRMTDRPSRYLHPRALGLTPEQFTAFARFRSGAIAYYGSLMGTLLPIGFTTQAILHYQTDLFDYPALATFCYFTLIYLAFTLSAVIYSNLVAFTVVAVYIHIKQKATSDSIKKSMKQLLSPSASNRLRNATYKHQFLQSNLKYSHLMAEMGEYNAFWSSYLTFIFFFLVLIIAYVAYVCLFGQGSPYMIFVYQNVFTCHVILLSVLIYVCGGIVRGSERLSADFIYFIGQQAKGSQSHSSLTQTLKMHHLASSMSQVCTSGFHLLNGYTLTHSTFQLLIVNIVIYFILIIKD